MSEVKEFFDAIQQEGELVGQEKETPAESSPESNRTETSPSSQGEQEQQEESVTSQPEANTENEEEKVPFHRHPRFKALIEEKQHLRQTVEDLLPLREEVERMKQELKEKGVATTPTQIPNWFSNLFGENEYAYQEYMKHTQAEREAIKSEIKQDFEREQQLKAQEQQRWRNWVDENLNILKEQGHKFNKNELMKIMFDYKPTDDQGNLSFEKGFDLYQKIKLSELNSSKEKKDIASKSISENKPESKSRGYKTSADLRGTDWFIK